MRFTKTILWVALLAILGDTACNYTDGPCYRREDIEGPGSDGVGGGTIVPGSGGFGDVSPEPQSDSDPESFECNAIGGYSASLFKFKTTVPDDGEGLGGGAQQASTSLNFVDGRQDPPQSWSCSLTVELPIRTSTRGVISASKAAEMSAEAATVASGLVMHSRDSWLPASFCIKFKEGMQKTMAALYPGCGARVF